MKKASLIACACALILGAQSLVAQEAAKEIKTTEDPSQGLMLNPMRSNWFIMAEGGADIYIAKFGTQRKFSDRFMPAAGLYVGKWFTPVIGGRIGISYLGLKGCSSVKSAPGVLLDEPMVNGRFYKTKTAEVGPVFDFMVNLTNWWCGYKSYRVYNAVFYVGAGGYLTFDKKFKDDGDSNWHLHKNTILTVRAGFLNTFNLNKHWALNLDITMSGVDGLQNIGGAGWNENYGVLQAYLGVTYNFGDADFKAPVIPVCPEPENCDALRARLAAADARIADLETQLKDCLSRPVETKIENNGPLATVYYPIGVSRLSRENQRVVKAIAYVMSQNPDKKYVVTGWADNYTGTDNINIRLRKNRAEGVQKLLVKNGVAASQLEVTTNNGNLSDLGEKCVALDRAVTIDEK